MEAYLDGDESALPVLIKNNLNLVYNFVRRMVKTEHNAEDITQETFVKGLEKSRHISARFAIFAVALVHRPQHRAGFFEKEKGVCFFAI